jgi:hypothetical protein
LTTPFCWRSIGPYAVGDSSWCALEIGPEALERRADQIVIDRLSAVGRTNCDVLIVQDLLASDLKVGWPTHRLMQMRDRDLCRYFAIEVHDPLEAEWIAGNAPIHAIIAPYSVSDMSLRYRTFEAARNAGVAIVSRARSIEDLAIQIATRQICATIPGIDLPATIDDLPAVDIDALWDVYQSTHSAPAKLRSGHPPETGA